MSSASQIDLAAITDDQLAEMLSELKFSRETEALRARLPGQLAPFASNISITKPVQTVSISPSGGIHGCWCKIKERKICMSVNVAPSLYSPASQPRPAQPIQLVWRDWCTGANYLTGSADSHMHSISLQYGPRRGTYSEAKGFTGWYQDPGMSRTRYSHGGIRSVVEEVVRDMGFHESELDNKVEVLEALLGDDGKRLVEKHTGPGVTLRKTIEDEIEIGMEEDF